MMTTMAALLGGLPLALGSGLGSELRRPLGIAMVGGLLVSQILTLYTTPVIYVFFDRLGAPLRQPHARGAAHVNLSAPFIQRPVATISADGRRCSGRRRRVRRAPGLAAAAGRLPDDQRQRVAARRERRDHGRRPSRRRWSASSGTSPGVTEMTSTSALGSTNITLQFDLAPQHRRRRARRPGRDHRGAHVPARQPADRPDVSQGQPGRRADHDRRA